MDPERCVGEGAREKGGDVRNSGRKGALHMAMSSSRVWMGDIFVLPDWIVLRRRGVAVESHIIWRTASWGCFLFFCAFQEFD